MNYTEVWALDCSECGAGLNNNTCKCANCDDGHIYLEKHDSPNGFTRVSFGCNKCNHSSGNIIGCPKCNSKIDVAIVARRSGSPFKPRKSRIINYIAALSLGMVLALLGFMLYTAVNKTYWWTAL